MKIASGTLSPFINFLISTLLVLGTTLVLWLLRDTLTPANISLVYFLVVLICAMYFGTRPSLLASIISFLCFNFFLVRPLYTFLVADPRELLDLFIFFVVSVLTGQLAARARQQTENAQQRAYEQDILYQLTSAFNQVTDAEGVYQALKKVLCADLKAARFQVMPQTNESSTPDDQPSHYLLLKAGDRIYSTLHITFDRALTTSELRLVNACTIQASMALQRIELAQHVQQSKGFEEADRLKTAILHAVSHDLRTPITIIKSSASNLLNLPTAFSEEERVEMYKTIEHEADQLNQMVGNLLDLSRLQAGALQMNIDWNSLEEVAGDVAARAWQLTHQERIKICFPEAFPLLRFDYGLFLQALNNLVENSLRYEPADSRIEICGSVVTNEVRVAVVNHGPNIAPEERDRMMEPFFHGAGGNIGLGLAIAKGIIESHKGRLWVEDTPGGGATFVVAFPTNGAHSEDETTHENSRR